jgi:hypothetical protein
MKIENLRTGKNGTRARVSATLIWEDRDRPSQEIFFETTEEFADALTCNPNAFFCACAIPAMHYGEKRIAIDSPICPDLKEGMEIAMDWIRHWSGKKARQPFKIEAKLKSQPIATTPRSGLFFSGGVDSLGALRANHLNFPPDHPSSIKDGLLISGFVGGLEDPGDGYEIVSNAIINLAKDAGLTLIPAYSNVYAHFKDLDQNFAFWRSSYHGSLLASVAHAFSNRLTSVSIAATYDIAHIDPWGSHPLLDVNYSSRNLKIKHENVNLSRLEKTKLISDWDIVRTNLCVCNDVTQSYQVGKLNCGKCEKCIRTKIGLEALGVLEQFKIFPDKHLSEKLIVDSIKILDTYEESCYLEAIEPLKARGRHDLVRGINRVVDRFHEKDLKGTIKRFDRTFLKGNLAKFGKQRSTFAHK